MAIYSNTLAVLVEKAARLFGDWKSGTVDSGSTTTVVDDTRQEPDDYFQNTTPVSVVRIITTTDGAAPQGESSKISDYVGSTGTISVSAQKPFTIAPGAADTYCILKDLDWEEVKWAVNMAIDMVAEEALFWAVDETTIDTAADTYEYSLPTNFMYLYRVSQADANGDYPDPIPPDQYRVLRSSAPKLHLIRFPASAQDNEIYWGNLWVNTTMVASRDVRLEGLVTPDVLSADTDTCPINPVYIAYQAAALLHGKRIGDSRYDPDWHTGQQKICQDIADRERALIVPMQLPPDSKRCRE